MFAVAVNGVIQTDESLDELAHAAELPSSIWLEPLRILRTTDNPQTADKELQRLDRRVEQFLRYGAVPGTCEER